jgi:hypothetical protein
MVERKKFDLYKVLQLHEHEEGSSPEVEDLYGRWGDVESRVVVICDNFIDSTRKLLNDEEDVPADDIDEGKLRAIAEAFCSNQDLDISLEDSVILGKQLFKLRLHYQSIQDRSEGELWKARSEVNHLDWNRMYGGYERKGIISYPIRRLFTGWKMRKARKRVEVAKTREQIHSMLSNEVNDIYHQFKKKQASIFFDKYVQPHVDEVWEVTLEFAESLVGSEKIKSAVQLRYIEEMVLPALEHQHLINELTEDEVKQFLKLLLKYLETRDHPEESEVSVHRDNLEEFLMGDDQGYRWRDVKNLITCFFKKEEVHVLYRLVGSCLQEQLHSLRISLGMLLQSGLLDRQTSDSLTSQLKTTYRSRNGIMRSNNNDVEDYRPLLVSGYDGRAQFIDWNIKMWSGVRDSADLEGLFSAQIKNVDELLMINLVDKALDDYSGSDIANLALFPTAETIRTLSLIAAAEYKNYRTFHANCQLNRLAKRKDWLVLVENAVNTFPELSAVKRQLLSWQYAEYGTNRSFKSAFFDTAVQFLGQDGLDERAKRLALESLPLQDLLTKLENTQFLPTLEANILRNALAITEASARHEYFGYAFGNTFKKHSLRLLADSKNDVDLDTILVIVEVGKKIVEHRDNSSLLDYYSSTCMGLLKSTGYDQKKAAVILSAPDNCPAIVDAEGTPDIYRVLEKNHGLISPSGLSDAQRLYESYREKNLNGFDEVAALVGDGKLTASRACDLPISAPELFGKTFYIVQNFPDLYMVDDEAYQRFKKLSSQYIDSSHFQEISDAMINGMDFSIAETLIVKLPILFEPEYSQARAAMFSIPRQCLRNNSDLKFAREFVGSHGRVANHLIAEYVHCLKQGVLAPDDSSLVMEFCKGFRIISPEIMKEYKKARLAGIDDIFMNGLRSAAQGMVGSQPTGASIRESEYYQSLLRAIYPNNAGSYGNYESMATCSDRVQDLEKYKLPQSYVLDLSASGEIFLREGEAYDERKITPLVDRVYGIAKRMERQNFANEVVQESLSLEIDDLFGQLSDIDGVSVQNELESTTSVEEKIFFLMLDALYGKAVVDQERLKDILITYEFAYFEDIRHYIEGTNDRVGASRNKDYTLLTELHFFFSDRLKEVHRKVLLSAVKNENTRKFLENFFRHLAGKKLVERKQSLSSKLRVETLGLNDSFLERISLVLSKRTGRKYSKEQVREIVRRYERITGGLTETTTSTKRGTISFSGQLRSQKHKTISAWKELTGQKVDPSKVFLEEMSLTDFLIQESTSNDVSYDENAFVPYLAEQFVGLFGMEKNLIESELDKFMSTSGKDRVRVNGYISKTKESAYARMVGGVCVSQDTPNVGAENMWDMPNYFGFVYQDPETLRCVGLCLLHEVHDQGKRILTVSPNPSSTFLTAIDEKSLFLQTMEKLEDFANSNAFDMVAFSQNKTIRTNRTGGLFEKAMDERVSVVGKTHTLGEAARFSYSPSYLMQELDVVWERDVRVDQ